MGTVLDVPGRPAATASTGTYRRRRAAVILVVVVMALGAGPAWSRYDTARHVRAATTATAEYVTQWSVARSELSAQIAAARDLLANAQGRVADPATLTTLATAITVAETVAPPAAIRPVPAGAGVDTAESLQHVAAAVVARQRDAAETLAAAVQAVQESCTQCDRAHAPTPAG
jgi:hypothetical protein